MAERAARWLRVSSDAQEAALQISDVDGYIAVRGYEVTRQFKLDGKSASKGEQEPALAEVVEAIKAGEFSVLVCWCLDRLDRRGIAESFGTKKRIEDAGGRVEFVLEPSMSDLEYAVKAWMAQQEGEKRNARVRIGLDEARSNGAATQAPPWGLRLTGPKRHKSFTPSDSKRPFIVLAFERVAAGESCASVARNLGGKKWTGTTVANMIHHPAYKGLVLDKGGNVVHRCEPVVDAALWRRANDAVAARERKARGVLPKALLAKVCKCGECGATMYRTIARRGQTEYSYYRCTNGCGRMIPTAGAEDAVNRIMSRTLGWEKIYERKLIPGKNWEIEIQQVKDELRHLDPDRDDYDDAHAELRAELARLKGLDSVPDRWELTDTGRTFGDMWAERDVRGRATWLHHHKFTVTLWRDRVRIEQGSRKAEDVL